MTPDRAARRQRQSAFRYIVKGDAVRPTLSVLAHEAAGNHPREEAALRSRLEHMHADGIPVSTIADAFDGAPDTDALHWRLRCAEDKARNKRARA